LISNALKHAFPNRRRGRILISFAHPAGRPAVLTVEDDGVGLPADFSFEQSETLGVQLVWMLTGQLGGRVHVGRGCGGFANGGGRTCFEVRFPLADASAFSPEMPGGLPVAAEAMPGPERGAIQN
jgi:two-component sensor histidine kinase